ncbi:hypothetical protein IJ596_00065 [bacterium]|nr:hypothetical protein [bacterium]
MAILPVSSVNLGTSKKINFKGDMEVSPREQYTRSDGDKEVSPRHSGMSRGAKYASVPVIVMMTLNPALSTKAAELSSQDPKQITMEMPYAPTETEAEPMYDFASEAEALSTPESASQTTGVNAPNAWYNTHRVVESFPFVSDGKKYSMQYMTSNSGGKEIDIVYFIPNGYDKNARENVEPPMFEKLVYHNLGKVEDNFAGAWTSEVKIIGGSPSTIYKEIRLPDEITGKLVDMLSGDYKMPPNKYIKENCIKEVFDAKLLTPEVIRDYY